MKRGWWIVVLTTIVALLGIYSHLEWGVDEGPVTTGTAQLPPWAAAPSSDSKPIAKSEQSPGQPLNALGNWRIQLQEVRNTHTGEERIRVLNRLVSDLCSRLPLAEARIFLDEVHEPIPYGFGIAIVGRRYAAESADAGWAWLMSNQENREFAPAATAFAKELGSQGLARAVSLAQQIKNPGMQADFLRGLAAIQQPEIARQLITLLNEGKLPQAPPGLAAKVVGQRSGNGDEQEAEKLASLITDKIEKRNAYRSLAMMKAGKDPVGAAEWLMGLPEEYLRKGGVDLVLRNWLDLSPGDASTWVAALPPGETRDRAVEEMVSKITITQPTQAFVWANQIGNAEQRRSSLQKVYRQLVTENPEEASRLITSNTVSESDREYLRRPADE